MKRVTIDEVMSWHPCENYTRKRVTDLFAGRETITALDIFDLDIPDEDKLWAVLRPGLIPEPTLHELACRFAEAALSKERSAGREPDPRSWAAIEAKRAWLRGEATDEELRAARVAAEDVPEAAWAAAWTAAEAAGVAVMSAAWAGQVEMVREILKED